MLRGLGAGLEDPGFLRARDDVPRRVLRPRRREPSSPKTLALACRVAKIARALTWHRALQAASEQGEPLDPFFAHAPYEELVALLR